MNGYDAEGVVQEVLKKIGSSRSVQETKLN